MTTAIDSSTQGETFIKYSRMVRAAAWASARRHNLEFEDVEAQAMYVFAEALRRFDSERAAFSTFLTHRLRTLEDYAKREERRGQAGIPSDRDDFVARDYLTASEAFKRIERDRQLSRLSEDARDVLNYLCGHEWETPGITRITRPTFQGISNWYQARWGWAPKRIREAWAELHQWWTEGADRCYA